MAGKNLSFVSAPAFQIATVPVHGDVMLSPMAGFSDSPYRLLCRRHGAAFSFTEFVSAEHVGRREERALSMFRFLPEERPILFQIFGNDPEQLSRGARVAEALGPDVVDLNMGCSVNCVSHKGSGAGMLRDPSATGAVVSRLVRELSVPVTAKMRIGWDHKSLNHREMARVLEDCGVSMISVHGRTKQQGYKGLADWDAIGETAAAVRVPVLGNGDVQSLTEARVKKRQYGLAGVLIGRAAIGNPWSFEGRVPTPEQVGDGMLEHLGYMLEFYSRGLILFRKHAARYIGQCPGLEPFRRRLLPTEDVAEFTDICLDLRRKSSAA